jgi:hypothetical protein
LAELLQHKDKISKAVGNGVVERDDKWVVVKEHGLLNETNNRRTARGCGGLQRGSGVRFLGQKVGRLPDKRVCGTQDSDNHGHPFKGRVF